MTRTVRPSVRHRGPHRNTAEPSGELTAGDVLTVGDTALAAARPAGWQTITGPLHIVRADEHGTHPLDLEEVISLSLTYGESESYPDLLRRLISPRAPSTAGRPAAPSRRKAARDEGQVR